jgi:type II secretory pathway pseudopilin PulG
MIANRKSFKQNEIQREQGYVLLAILFSLTLLVMALAAGAPSAATAIRRGREEELIHRGEQYSLAIRRFYRKFGRYPASLEQLENTNNIRFLRRKYLDPLTGKDDWVIIRFGEARPQLGFFGQKLTAASPLNLSAQPALPANGATSAFPPPVSNPPANIDLTKGSGTPIEPAATSAGVAQVGGQPSFGSRSDLSSSASGSLGGGAMVGVSVPVARQSVKEFQQKDHYNEWQFVYDPLVDPAHGIPAGASSGVPAGASSLVGHREYR